MDRRYWNKYHKPKDIAIALAVEASELLEVFQWSGSKEGLTVEDQMKIRHETADVVIYALSMANACGFDLGDAVAEKIVMNDRKYPVEESRNMFG